MAGRIARIVLRVIGWLLTPLVLITAAAIGAFAGLLLAPRFGAVNTALGITIALAALSAIVGLVLWTRLLRVRPAIQKTFAVTPEGLPQSGLVERLVHPDEPPPTRE